jgi:membrane protein DedA with SNARE-associated domain
VTGTSDKRLRKRLARTAYGLLLVLWVLIFLALGYVLGNMDAVSRAIGVYSNEVVGVLLLLAVVTGVLAIAANR